MWALFNSQAKTVTFAAGILAASFLISRTLGLLRDRLLAGRFGASQDLDIYFAAFRIPDFVYGILIMGGLSAVFMPVFAEYFKKDEKEAWRLVSVILNCFLIILIVLCGILAILAPWLLKFIIPGFNLEQRTLAVSLTRIMFLSPIFFGLSSIFSGLLHYFNRFLAYSIAPILYNLSIIFGILFFVPIFGVIGLVYGVILGAFLHFVIQIPAAVISGFKYLPIFDFKYPGLLKIFKFMSLRVVGASVYNINVMVITAIASTLASGSIAIFSFADNLQSLPIGLIGASFAVASFPAMSRAWANGARSEFIESFSLIFRQILFLIVPLSILLFLLRNQIVGIILGTGRFSSQDAELTAAALGFFSLGIFAFALVPFLLRVFFSLQDVKTPTIIGLIYMVINFVFCISFVKLFSFLGLPLAVSLSGIIYFSLLLILLRQKTGDIRLREIWQSLRKIILASILMAISIYFVLQLVAGIISQAVLASLTGIIVYILSAHLFRSPELKNIKGSIFKQFSK